MNDKIDFFNVKEKEGIIAKVRLFIVTGIDDCKIVNNYFEELEDSHIKYAVNYSHHEGIKGILVTVEHW